ncbi:PREDICTED: MMS19 nucleotide excision repair protein homolog [Dinoponera quadriceps]|uniref:MMS19 nucleotide excision repair protein n=1 Tax=Dinoponera quadriceps TaxID=609295 RepID=A0A6P3Y8X1_DINQU|nr:PREDICTED: MMS19 nucleotide excision repair protein homolog [Dinoponera quadriceps]
MLVMASSMNFDLKERLDINFTDIATLNVLCRNIATEIVSGSVKFYTFVETLGSYTTDQNILTREKGVSVLSSVLSQLPQNYLNESELHFMAMFYCDRLRDHDKVIPSVLNGILAIVNMSYLSQDSLLSLLRSIFQHVQCQSQLIQERRNIYLILKTLIENRLNNLRLMGPDLIDGIINTIDGERDPNNLMLLFSILPYVIREIPLGHLTEEMFAVVACYFPVDFNSSGREDLNLRREDLAEKLAPCLYATSEFTNHCVPLIIEKLYSTHKVAKLDSLNLLRDSVQTFGALKLQQYLYELWTALRKEVMPVKDIEIADAALEAITSLIRVISTAEIFCKDFIDKIITDTKPSLCNVQFGLYRPAKKLMETIGTVNKETCMQVLLAIVPLYIGQYSTNISWDDKTELIETLNGIMKICSDHGICIQDIPELRWTNISQIYLDSLTAENIKLKSKIFLGLAIQKSCLNKEQRFILYNAICDQIDTGCDEIQITCHTTILEFSVLYPQEIILLVKERFLFNADEAKVDLLKRRITTLLAIAKLRELGCTILPEIVTMLTNNINNDVYITVLLNIQKLIASGKFDFNVHQFLHEKCHIIDKLVSYEANVIDHKMLICNVCQLIIRSLTVEEQHMIVMKYAKALNAKFPKTDVAMAMNLLIPLRKDVNLHISDDIIENLCDLAISNDSPQYTREITCKFLSVLLNRMKVGDLDRIVSYLEGRISSNLKADIDVELKHTVDLQIRMTKALIMRGCGKSQDLLENLTSLLTHGRVGRYVSQQYQILVSNDDVLTEENSCDIKILYKQRVFEYLLRQNSNFVNSARQNYLIALVHSLEQMPRELKLLHLAELVPLLIETLSLNDVQLVLWALRSLKFLINTKHIVLSDNVQCIIPRLLQLTTEEIMDIRIVALECLTRYANYPTILIYPYKMVVLDKLGITIDDRKRLVRKAAVEARTQWFIVGVSED